MVDFRLDLARDGPKELMRGDASAAGWAHMHASISGLDDIMHGPIQVPCPDVNSGFCEDPAQARAVRRRVLSEAAEHNHLLLPAHFGTPHIGRVRGDGEAFAFIPG